jgi:Carboxypeptidase regulatory-like domain
MCLCRRLKCFLLFLVIASAAIAQELTTGSILGIVHDQSGAVVPGATITVTNKATGAERTVTSSTTGEFSLPGLLPSTYDIKVENPGFRAYVEKGLELRINQVLRLDVRLQVGEASETVTVIAAETRLLETETGMLGQVIDQHRMTELPLNGRNLVQLAALSAGISPRSFQRGTQYGNREQYVTIEGGRDSSRTCSSIISSPA